MTDVEYHRDSDSFQLSFFDPTEPRQSTFRYHGMEYEFSIKILQTTNFVNHLSNSFDFQKNEFNTNVPIFDGLQGIKKSFHGVYWNAKTYRIPSDSL